MSWFRRGKRPANKGEWERASKEVAAAKARRMEATADARELVDAVSQALFRADPVGINFETNTDEYVAEAETIVIALPKATSPQDVQALTHECFVQWFDPELAGPPSNTRRLLRRSGTYGSATGAMGEGAHGHAAIREHADERTSLDGFSLGRGRRRQLRRDQRLSRCSEH